MAVDYQLMQRVLDEQGYIIIRGIGHCLREPPKSGDVILGENVLFYQEEIGGKLVCVGSATEEEFRAQCRRYFPKNAWDVQPGEIFIKVVAE